MEFPSLIEPNVKNYVYTTLRNCHEYKMNIFSWVLNTGVFIIFFSVFFLILYLCRKEKLSPFEKHEKMRKEQEYVLSKIRDYQEMHKQSATSITDLPVT